MSDRYQGFVQTPIGKLLVKNLGLPNPVPLERYVDGGPEDKRFQDWFSETFTREAGVTGGSKVRKSGMIHKFHQGERVMTFAFFDEGDPVLEEYAEPTDELTTWLVQYVET